MAPLQRPCRAAASAALPGPFAFHSRYRSPSETERRHMARRSNPGGSSPSLNRELVSAAATRSEPANRRLTGDSSETPTWPPARVRVSSPARDQTRSEEHTSELQSPCNLVCRLLLEKKKN